MKNPEGQARLHEKLALREEAFWGSCLRNIHEMEELKRAQEVRVDECSLQKLRESRATIQELISQIKSLICVDPRPKLAFWHMEFVGDTGKRFWQSTCNARSITDILSRNSSVNESKCHRWNPVQRSSGKFVAKSEEITGSTIPMPIFARMQSNHEFYVWMEISELHFDKFFTLSTFSCWKIRFNIEVSSCSDFLSEVCYGSKKRRWSNRWMIWNHRDQLRVFISPNFEMLDARIASALDNIIQNSYVKKAQKEDRFLPERRIAYMIFDYSRVISAHDTVRDYADLFSVTLRNEYFKTLVRDGMKLYCRWKRSHQMMF